MQSNRSSKPSAVRRSLLRLLLSLVLPLLLALVFLSKQFINFDGIGWSNGFSHPLTGWDHLLTMLAVGIWAAQLRGQAIWMLPLAFVGVMSLGGLAGAAGLAIPSVEGIILLSTAVFSVLITRKVRFSTNINLLIVAFFAFFHGFAHGQEISTSASLISYTLGFMLATLLLHGTGILVAKLVVFGVTCLLTALFSSAALAKTTASIIDGSLKVDANSSRLISHGWSPEGSIVYREHYHAFANEVSRSDGFFEHQVGLNGPDAMAGLREIGLSDLVNASIQTGSDKLTVFANAEGLIFKSASVQTVIYWRSSIVSSLNFGNPAGLDFKHYFPDINHTPGTHLLGNGVGLTSPPVAIPAAYALQVVPDFLKSPFPLIEESNLRSIVAKFDAGKCFSMAHKLCNHAAAHDSGHDPLFTAANVPRLIRSFLSLVLGGYLNRRNCGATSLFSKHPLLFPGQGSSPWQMEVRCCRYPLKNNALATYEHTRRQFEKMKNGATPAEPTSEETI